MEYVKSLSADVNHIGMKNLSAWFVTKSTNQTVANTIFGIYTPFDELEAASLDRNKCEQKE